MHKYLIPTQYRGVNYSSQASSNSGCSSRASSCYMPADSEGISTCITTPDLAAQADGDIQGLQDVGYFQGPLGNDDDVDMDIPANGQLVGVWLENLQPRIQVEPSTPPPTKRYMCGRKGCPQRTKVWRRRCDWLRHQGSHTKPHFCPHPHCERHTNGFSRKDNLTMHLKGKMHKDCCPLSNIRTRVKEAAAALTDAELVEEMKIRLGEKMMLH